MKRADGIEVCSRVVRMDDNLKVVVLTSYTDADEARNVRQAGAAAYLLRGIDILGLTLKLTELMNGGRAESNPPDN